MNTSSNSVGSSGSAAPVRVDADSSVPVRVIELAPGQKIQATVVDARTDGAVSIGILGSRVAAFSKLALDVGQTYEFTVTAVQPRVILSAARPIVLPDVATAAALGKLGPQPSELAQLIRGAMEALVPSSAPKSQDVGRRTELLQSAMHSLARGEVSAEQLRDLHRLLGHDQEARVLRVADRPSDANARAEAVELRSTLKAEAIRFLDHAQQQQVAVDQSRAEVARQLVDGLSSVEVENSRRAEHGSATWLPLPASPDGELRDARMFLLPSDSERDSHGSTEEGRSFRIVLLLDMSRLGTMRVDVALQDQAVSVDFEVVELGSALALRAALEGLKSELENGALQVGRLMVRQAPGRQLSIADLCAPPEPGECSSLVDIHA